MLVINSTILLLVLSVSSITAEPIFFGGRKSRQQRPIPTLPPLPSRFRLGSQRSASRFTVNARYIDSPVLKSLQNSIVNKEEPSKDSEIFKLVDILDTSEENISNGDEIFKIIHIADISGENLLDDDDFASVTEADVEDSTATDSTVTDSTATDAPAELRELESELEFSENSILNENKKQKLVTDTLFNFDSENIVLENILLQNFHGQNLVTESFFKVIDLHAANENTIPNFINPLQTIEHFISHESIAKQIPHELATKESLLETLINTVSITVTETEYASVSYTPLFITVTDVVVETDCIKLNLPNTVTVYDTETVTNLLTEYIHDSQINGSVVRTVTDTRYSTTTVTPSKVSIVQTITDLLQVKTCTCVI